MTASPPCYIGNGGTRGEPYTAEDFDSADQRANVYAPLQCFMHEIYVAVPFVPGPRGPFYGLPTCPFEILACVGFDGGGDD